MIEEGIKRLGKIMKSANKKIISVQIKS